MPDTQRLGIVAYGRWTRQAVASVPWRRPEDALRFLDIAEDVDCSVRTTASGNISTSIKPLDTTKIPGLEARLAQIEDVPEAPHEPAAPLPSDPYAVRPFADWKQTTAPAPALQPPPPPWSQPAPAPSFQAGGRSRLPLSWHRDRRSSCLKKRCKGCRSRSRSPGRTPT
ncbi:hypothetical protein [Actinomadura latina]|uniref:Uncharacterized protein n=1 Tax=Actinomadura latina TaxID=163603 RepID=A0A846Z793_9ACTN|nr:hypothetical protein [Actinomadura latina]NKZ06624.1 hypothetical protein [Actinomadura latina]